MEKICTTCDPAILCIFLWEMNVLLSEYMHKMFSDLPLKSKGLSVGVLIPPHLQFWAPTNDHQLLTSIQTTSYSLSTTMQKTCSAAIARFCCLAIAGVKVGWENVMQDRRGAWYKQVFMSKQIKNIYTKSVNQFFDRKSSVGQSVEDLTPSDT